MRNPKQSPVQHQHVEKRQLLHTEVEEARKSGFLKAKKRKISRRMMTEAPNVAYSEGKDENKRNFIRFDNYEIVGSSP